MPTVRNFLSVLSLQSHPTYFKWSVHCCSGGLQTRHSVRYSNLSTQHSCSFGTFCLCIGGMVKRDGGAVKKEVYMHVATLPPPFPGSTPVIYLFHVQELQLLFCYLQKILVIGGWCLSVDHRLATREFFNLNREHGIEFSSVQRTMV